ncbi:MAG: SAM-dependent methyltransferase, partial [Candidatus Heimdallarchaeota archaeon]|nr:SAM-dependent methyltransferase [Candidatus Heimdallarchaeota archaeon]
MDEFNQANMERWNILAKAHYGSEYYGVKEFLEGKSSLFPIEEKELPDITGKSLLHLQCHFGMDTLSLARKGAVV